MIPDNAVDIEPTIFSALITPHRSLSHAGFMVLIVAFGVASFITGIAFLLMGAWPVFGFFGLDALLLYGAFRLNYRHALAYEEVTVTSSRLTVRKVSHRGRVREWALNPLWVRLEKIVIEDFGVQRLILVSRGRQLVVGSFLAPAERESFAKALGDAIGEAKRGPTRMAIL